MKRKAKICIDARKLTLSEWLHLILSPKRDVDLIDYEFPTEKHRNDYLKNIGDRSEEEVIMLLQHFLIPSSSLGIDESHFRYFSATKKDNPERYQRLSRFQYFQRLLLWAASGKRTPPPWEGITWILDLLPHFPRSALDTLSAYFLAHAQLLPDGRFSGLGDAAELIRAKFIRSPETISERINLLRNIDPRYFKCLVERLYNAMGYETQLTAEKSDGGRDIVARHPVPGRVEELRVECKRYTHPVGIIVTRALLGVISAEKVNKGVIVATSSFTKGAKEFAAGNPRLELIPGIELIPFLNEYLGLRWPLHIERLVAESLRNGSKKPKALLL